MNSTQLKNFNNGQTICAIRFKLNDSVRQHYRSRNQPKILICEYPYKLSNCT